MVNRRAEEAAVKAVNFLKNRLISWYSDLGVHHSPHVGVVLGTGWGDSLELERAAKADFKEIPGFEVVRSLDEIEGHSRMVVNGRLRLSPKHLLDRAVCTLRGRLHLNEDYTNKELAAAVRLQTEMLIKLGVKALIVTSAVGSLTPEVEVGDIVVVDGFCTLFAPDMPLYSGEFCSPEDTLLQHRERACEVVERVTGRRRMGGHVMVRGPFFEGRKYDKAFLRSTGASVVGMSMLPEACIAALYGIPVIGLGFVTNTADETHSHEENQRRARERSADLGKVLTALVEELTKE